MVGITALRPFPASGSTRGKRLAAPAIPFTLGTLAFLTRGLLKSKPLPITRTDVKLAMTSSSSVPASACQGMSGCGPSMASGLSWPRVSPGHQSD